MPNKMLIDATHPEETRVVVVRGNRVEEFDFESAQRKQLRGNIYLAKVTRVEPSLQAAFIEYGGNRHGFLAFSEIHPDYYQIPVADRQALIEAAHAAGKGILFLTPHLGCFEATAQAYASRYGQAHGPITVLYRPARKPWLRELVDQARARPGLATAQTTLSGVRQMLKALRQGEAVGLLPDQVPPAGLGVDAPFFGREAWTMTLSSRLALQTGATVLLAWGERRSFGRGFVIHLRALLAPLADDPLQAAAQVNAEMQRLIRECPQQYLWGYARYKRPTRGTPAAGTASR